VRNPGRGQRLVKQGGVLLGEPLVPGGARHEDGRADLGRRQVRAVGVTGDGDRPAWNEAAAAILSPAPPAATIVSRPPMQ
jgi:hypothetical protein